MEQAHDETAEVEAKRSGSWLPFYLFLLMTLIIIGLEYFNEYAKVGREWEQVFSMLGVVIFWGLPVWMIISVIRYWKASDWGRAVIGALCVLALVAFVAYGPIMRG